MSMRPAMAALSCRACRSAVLRAIVSSNGHPSIRGFATQPPHQVPSALLSLLQSRRQFSTRVDAEDAQASLEENSRQGEDGAEDQWFLEVEPPRHAPSLHRPTLPMIPEDGPALLEPMMKYIYEDMGLDDLALLDLRELDPPAALGPNLIMLFGTARSERHLHIASGRFARWLRRNYKVDARADGLIGAGELKTKLRRLRKKAKLMGTNTMIIPGGDNGLSTGWVCVNFSIEEGESGEAATYDESGRFSGFGSSQTGTTVVVQCMTESRRNELDLETLWQGILKRSLLQGKKIRGEATNDPTELERLVSSKVQLAPGTAAAQWAGFVKTAQQQRKFSTLARRLQAPTSIAAEGSLEVPPGNALPPSPLGPVVHTPNVSVLRQKIDAILHRGLRTSMDYAEKVIGEVLLIDAPLAGSDRLAIVDDMIRHAQERGLGVDRPRMLVNMITSIVLSPAYDDDMARAQKNLELLLSDRLADRYAQYGTALPERYVVSLMEAYAQRQQWDRFWDTFRSRTRFRRWRSPRLYECVFRSMMATQDAKFCQQHLGRVYAGMLCEEPPLRVYGSLYAYLKTCILIAEPGVEWMLYKAKLPQTETDMKEKALQRREFVRMLKDVEARHLAHKDILAREGSDKVNAIIKQEMPSKQQMQQYGFEDDEESLEDVVEQMQSARINDDDEIPTPVKEQTQKDYEVEEHDEALEELLKDLEAAHDTSQSEINATRQSEVDATRQSEVEAEVEEQSIEELVAVYAEEARLNMEQEKQAEQERLARGQQDSPEQEEEDSHARERTIGPEELTAAPSPAIRRFVPAQKPAAKKKPKQKPAAKPTPTRTFTPEQEAAFDKLKDLMQSNRRS